MRPVPTPLRKSLLLADLLSSLTFVTLTSRRCNQLEELAFFKDLLRSVREAHRDEVLDRGILTRTPTPAPTPTLTLPTDNPRPYTHMHNGDVPRSHHKCTTPRHE